MRMRSLFKSGFISIRRMRSVTLKSFKTLKLAGNVVFVVKLLPTIHHSMSTITNNNKRLKRMMKVSDEMSEDDEDAKPPLKKKRKSQPAAKTPPKKCELCQQFLENITFHHATTSNEKSSLESIALTSEKLSVFSDDDDSNLGLGIINDHDELPMHKLDNFNVYDKNGHLCPLDTGLIEHDIELFLSGSIMPIYADDATATNSIPAHDMGPIDEWYMSGYDGGAKALVTLVTHYAQYVLHTPSPIYERTHYHTFERKIRLAKRVIEFLVQDHHYLNPNYTDLLFYLNAHELNENDLLEHAAFVCEQVCNFDDDSMLATACMVTLIEMSGGGSSGNNSVGTSVVLDGIIKQRVTIKNNNKYKDLTLSPVVNAVFDRRQNNIISNERAGKLLPPETTKKVRISWSDDVVDSSDSYIGQVGNKKYYTSVRLQQSDDNCLIVKRGDFVVVKSSVTTKTKSQSLLSAASVLVVVRVENLYDGPLGKFLFHGWRFYRATETILGDTAANNLRWELYAGDNCADFPIKNIVETIKVVYGGETSNSFYYYYSKRYESDTARFIDCPLDSNNLPNLNDLKKDNPAFCFYCHRKQAIKRFNTPQLVVGGGDGGGNLIKWRDDEYRVGSTVLLVPLEPTTTSVVTESSSSSPSPTRDETVYTEYYRKVAAASSNDTAAPVKSDEITTQPFRVGLIERINQSTDIDITVRLFYRPLDTIGSVFLAYRSDLNLIYWTDEVIVAKFGEIVQGKCYIVYDGDLRVSSSINNSDWYRSDSYRFYFNQSYDVRTHQFDDDVPDYARKTDLFEQFNSKSDDTLDDYNCPLKCLEIFAGCGGLSLGLHQSGAVDTKWAIELDSAAAESFQLNHPDCKVFTNDCNEILAELILSSDNKVVPRKGLPSPGDVEILIGGPPCQGFSAINRFHAGDNSLFKNSLIATYLSFCEYYRPKYCILENVRNFVTFNNSTVLKLTMNCFLALGYQVTFGIVQAGHYGVPQTRRRTILMACRSGFVLPKFPEPRHVFDVKGQQLSAFVDGKRYRTGNVWTASAPYRTINIRDALLDLPDIIIGDGTMQQYYATEPVSHYQKLMRATNSRKQRIVYDHVCKQLVPIVQARIDRIPTEPGSDWRDLPNICVELSDGTVTNKLYYLYRKDNDEGRRRGVCRCCCSMPNGTRRACDPTDRQLNTLIPWCLPHTGDRHNNWAGLYGRLEWNGYFRTTITNPEPMGKQGTVLHPDQNRVVSVRECARSQGFPDSYRFAGTLLDRHRQIGNAVPPPLGAAIGREINRARQQCRK